MDVMVRIEKRFSMFLMFLVCATVLMPFFCKMKIIVVLMLVRLIQNPEEWRN